MAEPTVSATGSVLPSSWRIPTSRGPLVLEVAPVLFGRKVIVRQGGLEIARFPEPSGQQPWVEHVLPNAEHTIVLVLVWETSAVSAHLFVDGLDLRDGQSIDSWRARAPKPMDRFEQNIIHGWVMKQDLLHPELGLLGGVGVAVATIGGWPLPVVMLGVVIGGIAAIVCVSGWLWVVQRLALWLVDKRTWNDGLRAEAVFLVMVFPIAALFILGWFAANH